MEFGKLMLLELKKIRDSLFGKRKDVEIVVEEDINIPELRIGKKLKTDEHVPTCEKVKLFEEEKLTKIEEPELRIGKNLKTVEDTSLIEESKSVKKRLPETEEHVPVLRIGKNLKLGDVPSRESPVEFLVKQRDGKISLMKKTSEIEQELGLIADQFDAYRFLDECVKKYPDSAEAVSKYRAEYGVDMYARSGETVNIKSLSANEFSVRSKNFQIEYQNKSSTEELASGMYRYRYKLADGVSGNARRYIHEIIDEKLPDVKNEDSFVMVNYINACAQKNIDLIKNDFMKSRIQILHDALTKESVRNLEMVRAREVTK